MKTYLLLMASLILGGCSAGPDPVTPGGGGNAKREDGTTNVGSGTTQAEPVRPSLEGFPKPDWLPRAPDYIRLPRGFRVVVGESESTDDLAFIHLALPHYDFRLHDLGTARLAAELAVSAPAGADGKPSLRREVSRIGGQLDVTVDAQATRIQIVVPRVRWLPIVRALATAGSRPPESLPRLKLGRDDLLRRWTIELAENPLDAAVARIRSYEPDGLPTWLDRLQDVRPASVALHHRAVFRANGAVLAIRVPKLSTKKIVREVAGAFDAWFQAETADTPRPLELPPPAAGGFWGRGPGNPSITLVFDVPGPAEPFASQRLIALECLVGGGNGGRIGKALVERLGVGISFATRYVAEGVRRRLELQVQTRDQDVGPLFNLIREATQSLEDEPPRGGEIRDAARRATLAVQANLFSPGSWVAEAARGALAGAPPTAQWNGTELDRPEALPIDSWIRTLTELNAPERLDLTPAFEARAEQLPLMVVVGGNPLKMPSELWAEMNDALVPASHAEAVVATDEERELQAREVLAESIRAIGGIQRVLALQGFEAVSTIRTGRSPLAYNATEFWLEPRAPGGKQDKDEKLTGPAFHAVDRLLATTIETWVTPKSAEQRVGNADRVVEPSEAAMWMQEWERHPLLILAAAARDEVLFHLVSRRQVGDREHAVLERIGDGQPLRLHIDTGSGLIRVVETQEHRDIGPVFVRETWRDYRNSGRGVRVPFRRTRYVEDATHGVVTTWQSFSTETPDRELLNK